MRLKLDINLSQICGVKESSVKALSQLKEVDLNVSNYGETWQGEEQQMERDSAQQLDPSLLERIWELLFTNIKTIIVKCPTLERLIITVGDPLTSTEKLRRFLQKVSLVVMGKDSFEFKIKVCTAHDPEFKKERHLLLHDLSKTQDVVSLNLFDKYRGCENL